MEELISVIVPIYNAAAYLEQAVQSIQKQTYCRIEIILVNDGSTDESAKICDTLAEREQRIRVLHKKNEGLTAAWKSGMRIAKGAYIGFVDSDDYIAEDMYEVLYREAQHTGADIVCCGIRHVFEENTHRPWDDEMLCTRELYTKEQSRQELFPILINNGSFMGRTLQPNRVSKLIRKELILNNMELCDDGVTVGEDFQFSLSIFPDAEKIAVIKGFLPYFYRVNPKSMTGGYDRSYLGKIKYLKFQLERISERKDVYDFKPQISNDFLCLTVLHIKGEIVRNRKAGYLVNRKNIHEICMDADVRAALQKNSMQGLTMAEKLFLFWMKHHFYFAMYFAVKIYFRDSI